MIYVLFFFFFERVLIKFCDMNRCVARFTYCLEKEAFLFYGLVMMRHNCSRRDCATEQNHASVDGECVGIHRAVPK